MQVQVLNESGPRVIALVFETGEEPLELLTRFAAEHELSAASFTAIGAFSEVALGYFDWQRKDYERSTLTEQLEVLSLIGDISVEGDKPRVHAHVVLGRRGSGTLGGHLLGARVRPTLELVLTESPAHLRRFYDPESGIALIRTVPGAGARQERS